MNLLKTLKSTQGYLLILVFIVFSVSCSDDAKGPAVPINPDPTDTVPPAVVSGATFGDLLNVITWVNPADADFSKVLILRNTSSIVDAPSAGKEYTVGGALIGTSRVVHNANSLDFSDSAATAGTLYYYKIFAYDASRNYAAGVEISATRRSGKTIFVNATASGANDGTSWSNAFSDLRSVLFESSENKVAVADAGDQIVVAAGVYKPAISDRTISFKLVSNVKVYGGFVGTEHSLSQRNWRMNKSILSGDLDSNDVDSSGGVDADGIIENADYIKGTEMEDATSMMTVVTNKNSKSVVTGVASATLDGFTITAGQSDAIGGGMHHIGDNLTLSNITFSGNAASAGSGIYIDGDNLKLSNVIFSGNRAAGIGGGLFYNSLGKSLTLSNVIFSGNRATGGGGLYFERTNHVTLSNVIFSDNMSTGIGGAVNIGAANSADASNIFLINVIMWGNTGATCTGTGTGFKGNESFCTVNVQPNISHSLIQGCGASGGSDGFAWATGAISCGTDGTGNIDGDRTANNYLTSNYPMFVNAADAVGADNIFGTADDGLRLMTGSPAINTGSNIDPRFTDMRLLFEMGAFDLAGNSRIVGGSIDMGAYESQ